MKFWYEGFNVGGTVFSGEFDSDNKEEASEYLRAKGIYPQQIKEVGVDEIKPVLPQGNKFEEDLGLGIPLRETLKKDEEQKKKDGSALEETAVLSASEVKEAVSASCCDETSSASGPSAVDGSALGSSASGCCSNKGKPWSAPKDGCGCGCCGLEDTKVDESDESMAEASGEVLKKRDEELKRDLLYLAEGANVILTFLAPRDSNDITRRTEDLRNQVRMVTERVMSRILYDYVKDCREDDYLSNNW